MKPIHAYQHQPYHASWQRYRKNSESSNSTCSDYSEPSPSTTPPLNNFDYGVYSPSTSTENLCRRMESNTHSVGQNQFRKLVDTISEALECEELEKRRYFLSHEAEAILYGNTQIFESLSLASSDSNVPEDLAEIDVTPFRNLISPNFSSHISQTHLIRALNQ